MTKDKEQIINSLNDVYIYLRSLDDQRWTKDKEMASNSVSNFNDYLWLLVPQKGDQDKALAIKILGNIHHNLSLFVYKLRDEDKKKILEVEFNHGGVYQYFDVSKKVYDDLMDADSHGRYFVYNIRDCYEYGRIK